MSEATDEQDLVKALDSVAGTVAGGMPSPAQPQTGAVTSPFPPIEQLPPPLSQDPPASATGYLATSPATPTLPDPATPVADNGPLASIKQDALVELRPLVDKLNVSPEEKFDTYLLLIRSTDDMNLIEPAHEAAKLITDETRRAEALLDIIKEIDYLSRSKTDA